MLDSCSLRIVMSWRIDFLLPLFKTDNFRALKFTASTFFLRPCRGRSLLSSSVHGILMSFIFHKHSHLDSLEGQWWGLSLRARKITCLNSLNNGLASLTQVPEMKSHLPMGQSNFHKSLPLADEQSELSRMGIQWFLCAPEHNDWDVSTSLFA